jgi:hypothetical protein
MKTLFAFGLCIVSAASVAAQSHALSHPLGVLGPVSTAGALGGTYVSPVMSRPLGGVALPTFGPTPVRRKTSVPARTTVAGYVGPIYYTPNALDSSYYSDTSAYPGLAPANTSYGIQPSGQPVVINQYFVTKGSSVPGDIVPNNEEPPAAAPANAGDPLAPPASYYLIAYKDHSIYSALAYWIEGDTLHYVTTQNTHNQASLTLIDVDQTYKLNTDRSVPFSIPGK